MYRYSEVGQRQWAHYNSSTLIFRSLFSTLARLQWSYLEKSPLLRSAFFPGNAKERFPTLLSLWFPLLVFPSSSGLNWVPQGQLDVLLKQCLWKTDWQDLHLSISSSCWRTNYIFEGLAFLMQVNIGSGQLHQFKSQHLGQ